MKVKVKVENLEFSDFTITYHLFRLENLREIYYVHQFIALLLVLVCRHRPHEFSSEHGMKLTSDTDMGISFLREQHNLKYFDVHEKFNFLKIQDLRATLCRDRVRLKKCGTRLEKWIP